MEIATLQQIISQESRAGSGGSSSPANTFISESNQGSTNHPLTIPVITAESARDNTPNGDWTTSPPTYTRLNSKANTQSIVHYLLAGQMDDGKDVGRPPELQFHHKFGGIDCNSVLVSNHNVNYAPFHCSLHFVRNPTSSAISFSYTNITASHWATAYMGAGACILTPDATTYAGVTDFTYTNCYDVTINSDAVGGTIAGSVQPGQTIAIVTAHSFRNWTTITNGGHWAKNFNPQYNNLYTGGLVPDYKLYAAHHQLRDRDTITSTPTTGIAGLAQVYNMTGTAFGENA